MVWAFVVLFIGLLLLLVEVFIPSAGALFVLASLALIWSIVLAFQESRSTGITFSIVVMLAIPIVIGVGFHYWPRTPFGRRMSLAAPTPEEVDPADERDHELRSLVGQVGRTITHLRPGGISEFNGRRVDTIAEGVGIDSGSLVRVVSVQGSRVTVRAVESDALATEANRV